MPFASINPATGSLIRRYRLHTRAETDAIVDHLVRAQQEWREQTPRQRARLVRALARALRGQRDALAALITQEMGKPLRESQQEVEKCAAACEFLAAEAPGWLQPEQRPGAPKGAQVVFAPLGVVLGIMPWNFPFWQVIRALVPALIAGNTFLLKHAPGTTGCAEAIERLAVDAGWPPNLLRTIRLEPPAITRLIADPRISAVTLTGSTAAGRAVAAAAGAALKPCVCELGGSDAYLVLQDADLDVAISRLTQGRLLNAGQSCIAPKRLIVVRPLLRTFEERLVAAFAERRSGDPMDPATELGPLARDDLRATLHRQVQASIRAGARRLLGGRLPRGPGFYYPPTVLTNVRPDMPAGCDELFGPVAAIIPARDEHEAVQLANQSGFGLGAGVFTRNRTRGRHLAVDQLEAGVVFVNDFVRSDPSLPFGGIKASGLGRELGIEGVRSMTNIKTVIVS